MRDKATLWRFSNLSCKLVVYILLITMLAGCKKESQEQVFNLKEVSVFDLDDQSFKRGQICICNQEHDPDIKAYPSFLSDKPLYGSIQFAQVPGLENSGMNYHFALDESNGTDKGYDLLYFDINRDLDLTNDIPITPLKKQSKKAFLNYSTVKKQICFDCINVNFDYSSKEQQLLELMPRLLLFDSGVYNLNFVTTKARKGKIKIAGQRYNVLLGHAGLISGSFDNPWTALCLLPEGSENQQPNWVNSDRLMALHKIKGTYYCFSATPSGNKLIVRPYEGGFGTFMAGAGGRELVYTGCSGSLCSSDKAVAVGGKISNGVLQKTRDCQLPVGDYYPLSLTVRFEGMSVNISDNYHRDGEPRGKALGTKTYGINIRKGESFVFDFSNEPKVIFASPAKDYRIKPGEELTVKAVLTDPELDIMIRQIDVLVNATNPKGKKWLKPVSLDPNVVIARTNSEKVADGVMPFG